MTGELIRYDTMCRAIADAYTFDEVKDIRNKAVAIEAYARQANNREAEEQAKQIRLRAERKVGQMLREMAKAQGAREPGTNRGTTRSPDETASPPTLADLGITKRQSADWQKAADLSDAQFERVLNGQTPDPVADNGPKPTPVAPDALWLWGRLRDFDRMGLLGKRAADVLETMPSELRADVHTLAPLVAAWLQSIGGADDNRDIAEGGCGERHSPEARSHRGQSVVGGNGSDAYHRS